MAKQLIGICPFYGKTCKDANSDLEKEGKVCNMLVVAKTRVPQGVQVVKMCSYEAILNIASDIRQRVESGLRSNAPRIVLPGQGPN